MLKILSVINFCFITMLANAGLSYTVWFVNYSKYPIVSKVYSPSCIYNAERFDFTLAPYSSKEVNLKTKSSGGCYLGDTSTMLLIFNSGLAEASIVAKHTLRDEHPIRFESGFPFPTDRVKGDYISQKEIKITFLPTLR